MSSSGMHEEVHAVFKSPLPAFPQFGSAESVSSCLPAARRSLRRQARFHSWTGQPKLRLKRWISRKTLRKECL
jgi:hypothetical protein